MFRSTFKEGSSGSLCNILARNEFGCLHKVVLVVMKTVPPMFNFTQSSFGFDSLALSSTAFLGAPASVISYCILYTKPANCTTLILIYAHARILFGGKFPVTCGFDCGFVKVLIGNVYAEDCIVAANSGRDILGSRRRIKRSFIWISDGRNGGNDCRRFCGDIEVRVGRIGRHHHQRGQAIFH